MAGRLTKKEFILKAQEIHGDKYDYSLINDVHSRHKLPIICSKHGVFYQLPQSHTILAYGCNRCGKENQRSTTKAFVEKANKVHNGIYDYSEVNYINNLTKVKIICKTHGVFYQRPANHTDKGKGCSKCNGGIKITRNQFISNATKIHKGRYDYSKVNYINAMTKAEIICKKHGVFLQTPNNHQNGKGCPHCNLSKGEIIIIDLLNKFNIPFEKQKRFNNCRDQLPLPFDFYIPSYNYCIEYDGGQHFYPRFGQDAFEKTILHDNIKTNFCKENNINLTRIKQWKDIEPILANLLFPICI